MEGIRLKRIIERTTLKIYLSFDTTFMGASEKNTRFGPREIIFMITYY